MTPTPQPQRTFSRFGTWLLVLCLFGMALPVAHASARQGSSDSAQPAANPFEGERFYLINAETGLFLDTDRNKRVNQSVRPRVDDEWEFERLDNGYYLLRNVSDGRYLDADGRSQGYDVDTSRKPKTDDEWEIAPGPDGTYTLRNREFDRFLDADGRDKGYNVDTSANAGDLDTQWYIVEVDQNPLQFAGQPAYVINDFTGRYLSVEPSGNVAQQRTPGGTELWVIDAADDGSYTIRPSGQPGYVEALGEGDGFNVRLADALGSATQWDPEVLADGTYLLRNLADGRYLDADKYREHFNVDTTLDIVESDSHWRVISLTPQQVQPPTRLSATSTIDTTVALAWFPGDAESGGVTYAVRVDGVAVATGLDRLSFEVTGLDPKTTYSFSVVAVDGFGRESTEITATLSTESGQQCAGRLVTVEIGLGEVPTEGDDVILGTTGPDEIRALGGNDIVCGGGGVDLIDGGPGDDVLLGGPANDTLMGGPGADEISGFGGADTITGGPDNDVLYGGDGPDTIDGGDGVDLVSGEAGNDRLDGSAGMDTVIGGPDDDIASGGEGDDTVLGETGNDVLRGGDAAGNEIAGDDSLDGGEGNDRLFGDAGADGLVGGPGDDELNGGDGADRLVGGEGINSAVGGPGPDLYVEPSGPIDLQPDDSVEEPYVEFDVGGNFDLCSEDLEFFRGFECINYWILFEHSLFPELSFEYALGLHFDCDLDPIVVPDPLGDSLQCLRMDPAGGPGVPANYSAVANGTTSRHYRRAYATFRSWGMSRPFDAYANVDPVRRSDIASANTIVLFQDTTDFRSRSTTPGIIEYGATAGVTEAEVTSDLFRQFIFGYPQLRPGQQRYADNLAALDSLSEWVTERFVNGNQPVSCGSQCSRFAAINQTPGPLIWEFMHDVAGGYGFVDRLLFRLNSIWTLDEALAIELGDGWESDFLAVGQRAPDAGPDLQVAAEAVAVSTAIIDWEPVAGASTYEVLLGSELYARTNIAGDFFVRNLEPDARVEATVRAIGSGPQEGRVIASQSSFLRTSGVKRSPEVVRGVAFASDLERCIAAGGHLLLDEAAEARAGDQLSNAREVRNGCFAFDDAECLQRLSEAGEDALVDCEDDVTQAVLATVAFANVTAFAAPAVAGAVEVGTACLTTIRSPCAAWAAENIARPAAKAAPGLVLRPIVVLAGKALLVVTIVAAVILLWQTPVACDPLPVAPDGFDPFNPDFDLYYDDDATELIRVCSEHAQQSTIYSTLMKVVDDYREDILPAVGDEWLQQQLRNLCLRGANNDKCKADEVVVYMPGGATNTDGPFIETGTHIHEALLTGPVHMPQQGVQLPWFLHAHDPDLMTLKSQGLTRAWYNYAGGPCSDTERLRLGVTLVCDEFPFATTNHAGRASGVEASLRFTSPEEGAAQGGELSTFYAQCLDNQPGKDYFVITPPIEYIRAEGQSVAFRITQGFARPCL